MPLNRLQRAALDEVMPRSVAVSRLTLTDFRCFARAELATDSRPVVLTGPNGAGKTDLLEALSLLTPGVGLRGARRAPQRPGAVRGAGKPGAMLRGARRNGMAGMRNET